MVPTHKQYADYGGRGITVCPRWARDFAAFFADMGPRPAGMSLDRKDNDGPYSPENCRWATPTQQLNNTRANRLVTFQGRTQTITEWARERGLRADTLTWRLEQPDWTVDEALTLPRRKQKSMELAALTDAAGARAEERLERM